MGSLTLNEALDRADTEDAIGRLKVVTFLESLPGVGKVKARRLMEEIGIAENRRVKGLGEQQRQALRQQLGLNRRRRSPRRADHHLSSSSSPARAGSARAPSSATARRAGSPPLAEPLLDHAGPPAGRGRDRLPLRRRGGLRAPDRGRRVHRVDPLPRPVLRDAHAREAAARPGPGPRDRGRRGPADQGPVRGRHLDLRAPASREEQQRRLVGRGDPDDKVAERLRKAEDEEPIGMALADHVVVNDDLEQTIKEMLCRAWAPRSRRHRGRRRRRSSATSDGRSRSWCPCREPSPRSSASPRRPGACRNRRSAARSTRRRRG